MKTVHGKAKIVSQAEIANAGQTTNAEPASTTRSKTSNERTPGQGSTHRLSRVVLELRSAKRKVNPQAAHGVMHWPAGAHNRKVELFDRCVKLFSLGCLSVTTSRGTVDAG
jgi:hypothetical protein